MSEFDNLNNENENTAAGGSTGADNSNASANNSGANYSGSQSNENDSTYHGRINEGDRFYRSSSESGSDSQSSSGYGSSGSSYSSTSYTYGPNGGSYNTGSSYNSGSGSSYNSGDYNNGSYNGNYNNGSYNNDNGGNNYNYGSGNGYNGNSYTYNPDNNNDGNGKHKKSKKKQKKAKKMKKSASMTAGKVVALGLCCALVGGVVGGVGVLAGTSLAGSGSEEAEETEEEETSTTTIVESSRTAVLESEEYDTTGEEMTASQIYDAYVESCVGITVSVTYNIFGYTSEAAASGSGFIISSDGYIVTNYHVVEDGDSDGITVTLYDDTTYDATLVGYDSSNDVAVLKIDATDLSPVVLGDSDTLSVGDMVVAIGNPLGELTFSLTQGVVSALDREVTVSSDSSGSSVTMNLIQTDAAINSGNSGGPLFNEYGEVIGITNAKYSSSSSSEASIDNIGFAIPINTVKSIIESIIENGYVEKPYLGVTLQTYSYTNDEGETITGAMIYSVESDSAAEEAGLQRGDLITAIDGEEITSSTDATTAVSSHAAGDVITITIDRNGETMDVEVTLGATIESATDDEEEETTTEDDSSSTNPYSYGYGYGY